MNNRGFISSDDTGFNNSYYLHSDTSCRTMSPNLLWDYGNDDVIHIHETGYISSPRVNDQKGGVLTFIFAF